MVELLQAEHHKTCPVHVEWAETPCTASFFDAIIIAYGLILIYGLHKN